MKASPDSQILLKEYWKKVKSGGEVLEYRIDNYGIGLLEEVKLSDIVPDVPLYMQNPMKPYVFTPIVFHHTVNYSTIKELHNAKRIWKPSAKRFTQP